MSQFSNLESLDDDDDVDDDQPTMYILSKFQIEI